MSADSRARGLVLIVEDEPAIADVIRLNLAKAGYGVMIEHDGTRGLEAVRKFRPAAVILDVGLPGLDGVEVCRRLRAEEDWTPVLFVTARDDEVDRILCLEIGADDYVTKPFSMDELLARLRAVMRRQLAAAGGAPTGSDVAQFVVGPSAVNLATHTVTRDGENVRLTRTEWAILELLLRHPNQLVTVTQLLAHVWGNTTTMESGHLRFHIARLRRKLEADSQNPVHILTEFGTGYRFVPGGPDTENPAAILRDVWEPPQV